MPHYRISEAAQLLDVSDDTIRRWVDGGLLTASTDEAGRLVIDGKELAARSIEMSPEPRRDTPHTSARNRLPGVVTNVEVDGVMAKVDLQCGPFRICSLMSREAAEELRLEVGAYAMAVVKATTVIVETPG